MIQILATLGLAALALTAGVNGIPTIEAKGSKLFTSDGNQFYVKGVYILVQSVLWLYLIANQLAQA
jgi:hypothetical protein